MIKWWKQNEQKSIPQKLCLHCSEMIANNAGGSETSAGGQKSRSVLSQNKKLIWLDRLINSLNNWLNAETSTWVSLDIDRQKRSWLIFVGSKPILQPLSLKAHLRERLDEKKWIEWLIIEWLAER